MYYSGRHFGEGQISLARWIQLWLRDHLEPVRRWLLGLEA